MAADLLADWWVHPGTVERFTGAGAFGDSFAAGEALVGFVDDSQTLVRSPEGEQVVSSARWFLPPSTVDIPAKSRVTLAGPFAGRPPSQVIVVKRHDGAALGLPSHLELALL